MKFRVIGRGWGVGRGKMERPWTGSQTHFCRYFHFVVESETIQRSIQAKRTCHWVIKILVGEARQANHQQTGSQRPRPSASGLLTFSACLTQNGLSCFPNFSRIEILPISCIIWQEENIKKGVNIYRLVLCCSVRFLNVVLQKRAVTNEDSSTNNMNILLLVSKSLSCIYIHIRSAWMESNTHLQIWGMPSNYSFYKMGHLKGWAD